jgi:hypothetical protein
MIKLPQHLFFFLLILASCGLQRPMVQTPEAFENERHEAIENHLESEFEKINQTYTSIAFGETEILKPQSYKILDSLYELKYQLEKKFKIDEALEARIEEQRFIVKNDTNKVVYIEDHLFSITAGDTVIFYEGLLRLNSKLKVDEIKIKKSTYIPKEFAEFYQIFLFEESFLNSGYSPGQDEYVFYAYFKDQLLKVKTFEQNENTIQILRLMKLAQTIGSVKINDLLRAQTSKHFLGNAYFDANEEFSPIISELSVDNLGNEMTTGYHLDYAYDKKTGEKSFVQIKQRVYFDTYLKLIRSEKID